MSLIIVRLGGGLGNQMFQYAMARTLALRTGASLKFDLTGLVPLHGETPRHFELDVFSIEATIANDADLALFGRKNRRRSRWADIISRRLGLGVMTGERFTYHEKQHAYDAATAALKPPVYLDGYWQSEKYFSDHADLLRREFTPRMPIDAENAAIAAQISAVCAVSLHVRRGDYVSDSKTNRHHGVCSLEYYERAIEYIRGRDEAPQLFVFSDDQEWTRANLRSDITTTYVSANPPDRGFRDMQLMALCRHHIIANSSFSWWGAWLNRSPTKIVVAPRRWFGDGGKDTHDMIPQGWVRM